jgi:hypothetical protein
MRTLAYGFDAENVGTVAVSPKLLICSAFRKTLHFPNYMPRSLLALIMLYYYIWKGTANYSLHCLSKRLTEVAIDKLCTAERNDICFKT